MKVNKKKAGRDKSPTLAHGVLGVLQQTPATKQGQGAKNPAPEEQLLAAQSRDQLGGQNPSTLGAPGVGVAQAGVRPNPNASTEKGKTYSSVVGDTSLTRPTQLGVTVGMNDNDNVDDDDTWGSGREAALDTQSQVSSSFPHSAPPSDTAMLLAPSNLKHHTVRTNECVNRSKDQTDPLAPKLGKTRASLRQPGAQGYTPIIENKGTCKQSPNMEDKCHCLSYCGPGCLNMACLVECPTHCQGSRDCGNQRITRRQEALFEVRPSPIQGRGLFLIKALRKGDFVVEYVGVLQDLQGLTNRPQQERSNKYVMEAVADVFIDATRFGNEARFVNHSCHPNCEAQTWLVRGRPRVGIFAKAPIRIGEEVTFDYGQWRGSVVEGPCKCAHPDCVTTLATSIDVAGVRCLTPAITVDLQQKRGSEGSDEEPQRRPSKRKASNRAPAPLKHPGVNPTLKAFVEGAYLPSQSAKSKRRGGRGRAAPAEAPPSKGVKEVVAASSFTSEWAVMRRHMEEHASFVKEVTQDWVIIPMAKDGNCFFSALSKALTWGVEDASALRSRVVEYIRTEGERFNAFHEEDKESYLRHMGVPSTFAGEMEIRAAEGLLGIRINVLSHTQATSESASASAKEVFLLHHFAHFDLLWPRKVPLPELTQETKGPFYPPRDQVAGLWREVQGRSGGPPPPPAVLTNQNRGRAESQRNLSKDDEAWNTVQTRKKREEKKSERSPNQGLNRRAQDTRTTWGQLQCQSPVAEGGHGYVEFLNPRSYTVRGWKDRFHAMLRPTELPIFAPVVFTPRGGSSSSRPRAEDMVIHMGDPRLTPPVRGRVEVADGGKRTGTAWCWGGSIKEGVSVPFSVAPGATCPSKGDVVWMHPMWTGQSVVMRIPSEGDPRWKPHPLGQLRRSSYRAGADYSGRKSRDRNFATVNAGSIYASARLWATANR